MPQQPSEPSVTQQVKFDAVCMQFEQDWRNGERPSIESFLEQAAEVERPLLLKQLLLVELEYLENAAAAPELGSYLDRFSGEQALVRRVFNEHAEALAASGAAPVARLEGTLDQEPIAEHAGSQIGRYKLLEQIGEGGMGVVYMAEQQRPVRRKVALKIIKPGMDTKQVVARFEAERQALAMMDHPNIARVLDAGSTDSGRPYFVMELVRGMSITEYCDKAKLETNERLKLFKSVCQAVQHAHTKGIIHRDLKPTNVLVTLHDGVPVPKIIDFGVSKAMGQQLTEKTMFTAFAQMVGTPLYMSPEQAEMSGLDIDTRSDIYSLGVLLYELLTGVTPFDRQRLHTAAFDELRRIIREEEPEKPSTRVSLLGDASVSVSAQRSTDPSRLKQLLRGELDWIVMKTLEKDRNRRYETANALVAEINRYLDGEPVNACPPSTTYRLRKFAQRYRAQVTVAGGFVALLLASSIGAWLLYADARKARNEVSAVNETVIVERDRAIDAEKTARNERDRAEAERDRAENEKRRADQHADELKARLYDYNIVKADAAYRQANRAGAVAILEECLEEHRGWEWRHLRQLVGSPKEHNLDVTASVLAASPTDPLLAVGDLDGGIRVLNETDGTELWRLPSGNRFVISMSFSSDGKYLAVTHSNQNALATLTIDASTSGGLQLREAATGDLVWEKKLSQGIFAVGDFTPNSRQFVVCRFSSASDISVQLRTAVDGAEVWSEPARGLPVDSVFSPDGQRLFSSVWSGIYPGWPSVLSCWSVTDHALIWSVTRSKSSMIAITPEGSHLVTGGPRQSIQIWDAATGEQLEEMTGDHSSSAIDMEFTRDQTYLVSRGETAATIWDWQTRQSVRTVELATNFKKMFFSCLLSSAGDHLLSLRSRGSQRGSRIQFFEVDPQPPMLTLSGHEAAVRGVAFTPDGQQVLTTGFDGTLRTWNTTTGQEVHTKAFVGSLMTLAYSPTGQHFATGSEEAACLWNAETGELVHRWPEARRVRSLQFSPDGQRLVAGNYRDGHGLKLFDVASGRIIMEPDTLKTHGAVFSADGQRILSILQGDPPSPSGRIYLWDPESSSDPQTLRPATGDWGHGLERVPRRTDDRAQEPRSGMSSSNLVAAGIENTIELWDFVTGKEVMTLRGHNAPVTNLAVNQDGSRLFSGDVLGVVKVWNLNTGEQLLSIQAHEVRTIEHWGIPRGVMSMALSPDEKTLATTGADGLVKLWETTRPSSAVTRQRENVRKATKAVDQQFALKSSRRDVFDALTEDSTLNPETLKVALDIANARGDLVDSERNRLIEEIEVQAGIDYKKPDVVPAGKWAARAYSIASPDKFELSEIVRLLAPDESRPGTHQVAYVRGLANARMGRWNDAVEDFTRALSLVPEKTEYWHDYARRQAFLLAWTGKTDRLRELCQKTLDEFGDTKSQRIGERTARICLLFWQDPIDVEKAGALADLMHSRGTGDSSHRPYLALTKGIADLRRDKLDSAIEMLDEAEDLVRANDKEPSPLISLYRAIVQANQGQNEEARQTLRIVVEKIDAELPGEDAECIPFPLDWLWVQIARREAEEIVNK